MSMSSDLQAQSILDPTAFNTYWSYLVRVVALLVIEMFFYVLYLNLFMVAIYTLFHRKTGGKRVLLTFTWVMAVLDTTQMVLQLVWGFMEAHYLLRFIQHAMGPNAASTFQPSVRGTLDALNLAQGAIFSINNSVTDSLFLYRCYMIWGSQWKFIVFPGLLIVSTFVAGCVQAKTNVQILQRTPYIMAAITNLVLLCLSAGRIWWIRRDARHIGSTALGRYSKIIAMIVESGAIYCIGTILLAVTDPLSLSNAVLKAIGTHVVNIVRTLIIVRVGLNQHTQPTLSNFEGRASTNRTSHSAHFQVEQTSRPQNWVA
ncbi:hypothetical protein MVEN_01301500 [Mycena venus]|uniref:Uncharacterized protein n=1 Tax=Mycena venus TaxID=2733690 RepID=A0A8H6Y1F2_9AGAR|nr:hypothetical protein MVEN_01301500 [Mycena venus]